MASVAKKMKRTLEDVHDGPRKRPADDIQSSALVVNGLIGSGNYGQVVSITMPSGTTHALKLTKKQDENDVQSVIDLARDVFGLSKSNLLLGLSYDSACNDRIGIHMPLLGHRFGNISVPQIPAEQVAAICGPIMHDMVAFDGLHRDIKLANMCFGSSSGGRARLVDFSLATNMKTSTDESVVTIWYRAPEILLGLEYTERADVWSMGLVLLNLLAGTHIIRCPSEGTRDYFVLDLFDHFGWPADWPELESIYKDKSGGHIKARPGAPPFINIAQLIQTSCSYDPQTVKLAFDLLSGMLKTDHRDRFSWSKVSKHPFWAIATEAPLVEPKITKLKTSDIQDFLTRSKTKSFQLPSRDACNTLRAKVILMDHIYYYGKRILHFNEVTVVKAFYIYMNAVHGGSSYGIPLLISSIVLAASFNEEIRPNREFTWDFLSCQFDEKPETMTPLIRASTIEALYNCSGHWPREQPSANFKGPMSVFTAICPDAEETVVAQIKSMEPGVLICI